MNLNDKTLSIALRMCDVLYDEKVKPNGHRTLLGIIHLQLKNDTIDSVNKNILDNFRSKGKFKRKLSHHQICQGASQYALQFYLLEGYSIETSKKLGSLTWNELNGVRYFNVDHNLKYDEKKEKLSSNCNILIKVCRYHHMRVNYDVLKTLTIEYGKKSNRKIKNQTFWGCYKDALMHIPYDAKTITEDMIIECLKRWNKEKNIQLFSV